MRGMSLRSTLIETFCLIAIWLLVLLLVAGCGSNSTTPSATASTAVAPRAAPEETPARETQPALQAEPATEQTPQTSPPRRGLGDLLEREDSVTPAAPDFAQAPRRRTLRPVDEAAIERAGIRRLAGRHLVLYTDLPPSAAVDALPAVFDQAVPQWCAYFGIDPQRAASWRMRGSLMSNRETFAECGLLPAEVPEFRHGYALSGELWLDEQPSDYYRRHLLLHEGTHGFMAALLGGCGPPWYMEGMAELLATHAYRDGQLRLNYFPRHRDEVPMLGRIKLVQDAFAARHAMRLSSILLYDARAHLQDEPYGWCWAAAAFLDGHPQFRSRFRTLKAAVREADFNQRFQRLYNEDWDALAEQWQLFVADLEHGYDLQRMAVDFKPGTSPVAGTARCEVAADRGWQNTGFRLEAGNTYQLTARGRYQLGDEPQTWWSEPGGVTLRYYQGRPLGILLAAVRPDGPQRGVSPLLRPVTVGLGATLTPEQSGTLYLRVNDSAGELADNTGTLEVTLTEHPE